MVHIGLLAIEIRISRSSWDPTGTQGILRCKNHQVVGAPHTHHVFLEHATVLPAATVLQFSTLKSLRNRVLSHVLIYMKEQVAPQTATVPVV
jgi:hypothetical protein